MKFCSFLIGLLLLSYSASVSAEEVITYQGQIDLKENQFDLVFRLGEKSSVNLKVNKDSANRYQFFIDIKHLTTSFFDLSSNIEGFIELARGDSLHGEVWSQYSLINYQPVRELVSRFDIKRNKFYLNSFVFGTVGCQGIMDLDSQRNLDFTFNLDAMDMNDFLNFWVRNKKYDASGPVFGKIKASGTLDNLTLIGNLESFNGFVKDLEFNRIQLNAEGVYPKLQISKSFIFEKSGLSYTISGPFTLSKGKSFKKQIEALTVSPLVSNSESEIEWTIKRLNNEESSSTEIKYLIQKDKPVGSSTPMQSDMLGIERRVEF